MPRHEDAVLRSCSKPVYRDGSKSDDSVDLAPPALPNVTRCGSVPYVPFSFADEVSAVLLALPALYIPSTSQKSGFIKFHMDIFTCQTQPQSFILPASFSYIGGRQ